MNKYEIQKKLSEISLISIMIYKIFFVILLCIFIYILFYITILLFKPKNNKYCLMLNKDKIDIIKSLMRVSWFFIVISIFYWLVQSKTFKFKNPEEGIKTTIIYLLIPLLYSYTLWQFEKFNFMECNFNQTLDTEYCLNIDTNTLYYWKITLVTIWILLIILSYFYIKDIFYNKNCRERIGIYKGCNSSNNVNNSIKEEEKRQNRRDRNIFNQFINDSNTSYNNDNKIRTGKIKLDEFITKLKKDTRVLVDPVPSGPQTSDIDLELKKILDELNEIPVTPSPPEQIPVSLKLTKQPKREKIIIVPEEKIDFPEKLSTDGPDKSKDTPTTPEPKTDTGSRIVSTDNTPERVIVETTVKTPENEGNYETIYLDAEDGIYPIESFKTPTGSVVSSPRSIKLRLLDPPIKQPVLYSTISGDVRYIGKQKEILPPIERLANAQAQAQEILPPIERLANAQAKAKENVSF
jgi:hypothetical protein